MWLSLLRTSTTAFRFPVVAPRSSIRRALSIAGPPGPPPGHPPRPPPTSSPTTDATAAPKQLAPTSSPTRTRPPPLVPPAGKKFQLSEHDIEEAFVRGSGPGGQKINKTSNNVQLLHRPTGVRVHCQQTRCLQTNRKIARKLLTERVDSHLHGRLSKRARQLDQLRKTKARKTKRAADKYALAAAAAVDKSSSSSMSTPSPHGETAAAQHPWSDPTLRVHLEELSLRDKVKENKNPSLESLDTPTVHQKDTDSDSKPSS